MDMNVENGVLKKCTIEGEIEIVIPNDVTSIAPYAFGWSPAKIKHIEFPGSVETIGEHNFMSWTYLKTIIFSEGLKEIGNWNFGVSACEEIVFPDSLIKLGEHVFSDCFQLVKVTIPRTIAYIGKDAFARCNKLKTITVKDGLKSKEKLSTALLKCPFQCDAEEMAYIALYQGDKNWKKWVLDHASDVGIDSFFNALASILQGEDKPSASVLSRADEYVSSIGNLASSESKAAVETVLASRRGKSPKTESPSKGKDNSSPSDIIDIFSSIIKPAKLLAWAEKKGLLSSAISNVKFAGSSKKVPKEAVLFIMYAYMNQMPKLPAYHANSYKTDIQPLLFSEKADSIANMLDQESLLKALASVSPYISVQMYVGKDVDQKIDIPLGKAFTKSLKKITDKYDPVYYIKTTAYNAESVIPYCRYAKDAEIATVTAAAENLIKNWDRMGRQLSIVFRSALLVSDTKGAFVYIDKYKQAELYAKMRGKTDKDIRDSIASATGLDSDGSMSFDL